MASLPIAAALNPLFSFRIFSRFAVFGTFPVFGTLLVFLLFLLPFSWFLAAGRRFARRFMAIHLFRCMLNIGYREILGRFGVITRYVLKP